MKRQIVTATLAQWTELSNSFTLLQQLNLPIRTLLKENNSRVASVVRPQLMLIQELLNENVLMDESGRFALKDPSKERTRQYKDYQFLSPEKEELVLREIAAIQLTEHEIELLQWSLDRPFLIDGEKLPLSSVLETNEVIGKESQVLEQLMETILYFE